MVEIANEALTARIDPLGAELVSLCDAQGRQLMTDADPAFWTGHAPLLFPIVGRLAGDVLRVDGRTYPMRQHGFARRRRFEVEAHTADAAIFVLRDDPETLASWPFVFELRVRYALSAATLSVEAEVVNRGKEAMPASFGFHPAFAWPLPYGGARDAHRIRFAHPEPAPIAMLDDGLIAPTLRPSPVDGDTLHLCDALFDRDALIWLAPESRTVSYGTADGPQIELRFADMPMLAVWTKPGARFMCIEPWHGHSDPVGFAGDVWDKPGIVTIGTGEAHRFAMQVTLHR
ncbi:aldose 1-epimerase family protein [Sphingomonas sp.]|uniref:aldose 1-epimerase family protein n=1 Tax=Sphingomonas sp. TaxID=28214 RepID=UPI001EBEDFA1|nr:aldose 1-epimerase family protein [Sphingomonas sp.]MBX3593536.1 aldose 1-epimerase family protein [Sphingomonas sp.]